MDEVTAWRRLTHSHGWLLPETYQLLKDMGNDFADALEGTASEGAVFRVTSVTRTDKQQRKLRPPEPECNQQPQHAQLRRFV